MAASTPPALSGSVILRRVKARQLDLGSISGDVVLDDVDCQQVEAQTVSGNVRFGGAGRERRPLRAELALRQRERRARRIHRIRGRGHLLQRLDPVRFLLHNSRATGQLAVAEVDSRRLRRRQRGSSSSPRSPGNVIISKR
jgi:hypothetical protein